MNENIIEIDGQAYVATIEDNEIVDIEECTPYNKTPAGMLQKELQNDNGITVGPKCAHIRSADAGDVFITIGYYLNADEIELVEVTESNMYDGAIYVQWDNVDEEAFDEPEARENKKGVKEITEGALFR